MPESQIIPQSIKIYIRSQGISAAIINAALNPALAWLGNRNMELIPLFGIIIDTAVTSIVLSLLVAIFVTSGFHRALKAGRVTVSNRFFRKGSLLSHLPVQAWALGLILGGGSAIVLVCLIFALFHLTGMSGISFACFALFKAIYTALLAFIMARWVILRQLLLIPQT